MIPLQISSSNTILRERFTHLSKHNNINFGANADYFNQFVSKMNQKKNNEGEVLLNKTEWDVFKHAAEAFLRYYHSTILPLCRLLIDAMADQPSELNLEEYNLTKIISIMEEIYPKLTIEIPKGTDELVFKTDINKLKNGLTSILNRYRENIVSVTLKTLNPSPYDKSRLPALQFIINGNQLPVEIDPTGKDQNFSNLLSLGVDVYYTNPGENQDYSIINLHIPNLNERSY
jgi:hypothetical protein